MKTGDSYDLSRWRDDEEFAAGFAAVVRVDAVVGLLLANELEGFMPAFGQWRGPLSFGIYAFGPRMQATGNLGGAGPV